MDLKTTRTAAIFVGCSILIIMLVKNISAIWWFTTDDAYITLRYAKHFVDGFGLVWNLGETPVAGYSNFSYLVISALAIALKTDPVIVLKIIGLLGLVIACISIWFITREFLGAVASLIPVFFLTNYIGVPYWSVSGLETGFYLGMVLTTIALWLREKYFCAFIVATVVALTRPEGALLGFVLIVSMYQKSFWYTLRRNWKYWLVFILSLVVYFVWHYIYFGTFIPNSARCKMLFNGNFFAVVSDYWSIASVFLLLFLVTPRENFDRRYFVLLVYPVSYGILLLGKDPIISYWNRHVLAPLACLMVLGTIGLWHLVKNAKPNLTKIPNQRFEILLLLGVIFWIVSVWPNPSSFYKDTIYYAGRMQAREALGDWIQKNIDSKDWVAIGDCGMVPWKANVKILDIFCINSLEISHPPVLFDPLKVAQFVIDRSPRVIVMHSMSAQYLIPRPEYGIYQAIKDRVEFEKNYRYVAMFGAPQDTFHYWVYLKK